MKSSASLFDGGGGVRVLLDDLLRGVAGAPCPSCWRMREVLQARWDAFLERDVAGRREAFRETRDRRIDRQYASLENPATRLPALSTLAVGAPMPTPVRYAFRSFDRQWALAAPRLGDFIRPVLWRISGDRQLYMTSILADVLGLGPAATVTSLVPDLHHFSGRGGKDVIPLWRDAGATQPNITHDLLGVLERELGLEVRPEDLFCYCYALLASPAYVEKFSEELTTPGPRIPITRDPELFRRAVELGRTLTWLHTYGERFVPAHQRRGRMPQGRARNTVGVPMSEEHYPETFSYDPAQELLRVGTGEFYPVAPAVWDFSVSGFRVLESWLSYRRKAGYGRTSSALDHIRPAQWTAALRDELLTLIWVLEATVDRFPELEEVFSAVLAGPTFAAADLPEPEAEERQAPAEEEAPRTDQGACPTRSDKLRDERLRKSYLAFSTASVRNRKA